jgi:hypothetical protein
MSDTDVELNNDTVKTDAMGANVRLFGAESAAAARPSSYGRAAVYATVQAALAADPATARAALDLEVGTDIQAYDADLTTLGAGGSGARDFLGLGTSDSPQFTAVNIGHATDTPVTRSAAGVLAVGGRELAFQRVYTTAGQINADLAAGLVVNMAPGTITCTEQIVVPTGARIILNKTTLDFGSYAGATPYIACTGTAATPVLVAVSAAAGDSTIEVASSSTFSVGQVVRIYSSAVFDPDRTDSLCGELSVIVGIAGAVLTLEAPLSDAYTTGNTSYVEPLTVVEDVWIEGPGRVIGNATAESTHDAIRIWRGRNCYVKGLRFYDVDLAALIFRDCMDCHGEDLYFGRTQTTNQGYGISFRDATQDCTARRVTAREVRHLMTTNNTAAYGGIPRRCALEDFSAVDSALASSGSGGDAVDTHAAAEHIWIRRGIIRGSSSQGVNFECPSGVIEDLYVEGCSDNGIAVHNETPRLGDIVVRRNRVRDCDGHGVSIADGVTSGVAGYSRVVADNNDVEDCTGSGVLINTASTALALDASASKNRIADCGSATAALYLIWAKNFAVHGNIVAASATTQTPIRFDDCQNGSVVGNTITMAASATAAAIRVTATSSMDVATHVAGNTSKGATPSSNGGLVVESNASGVTLGVNDFSDAVTPLSPFSYTIASGAITLKVEAAVLHIAVDTESAAASDDLDAITGGFPGMILVLGTSTNARDVTVKNGTGNIRTGSDRVLDNSRDTVTLIKSRSGDWLLMGGLSDNGS